MIIGCYNRFFNIFGENKKNFKKYSAISFLVGILELFGVALTYPFVLKLLDGKQTENLWTSSIVIGISIIFLFIAKNIFMIFYSYFQAKFTKSVEAELNLKFIKYFLTTDYQETSKIPLAKKNNILGFLIPNTINNFIMRLLNLSVNFFIFGLISLFLIIKFPLATFVTLIFAFCLILLQNCFFKPRLAKISKKISKSSTIYTQRSNEVLLNIKGVKISKNEKFFFDNYKTAIKNFYNINVETLFFNSIPPYITEPVVIVLLFILLIIISFQNFSEPQKLLASFAVIVSAIFRLVPTISRIQVNLNGINSALPIVEELLDIAENLNIKDIKEPDDVIYKKLNSKLELRNVGFEYEADKLVLRGVNLTINKGEFVGIAGLSGVGKTTLIDIIAGLLRPSVGEVLVDGEIIYLNNLKIGYIPQEVTLINAPIRENVAFGNTEINDVQVIEALKKAQLYDFIIENFEDGIYANPFVDSSGFSQGQKQRIAIARALYSDPDILILDEATSSLDLKTEDEFCQVLRGLKGDKTIIAIAHRLSTIKFADKIAFMQNSTIVDCDSLDALVNKNPDFKELIRLSKW